jgi:hypothetical protein
MPSVMPSRQSWAAAGQRNAGRNSGECSSMAFGEFFGWEGAVRILSPPRAARLRCVAVVDPVDRFRK